MDNITCNLCLTSTSDSNDTLFFKFKENDHYICEVCIDNLHIAKNKVLELKKDESKKTTAIDLPEPKKIYNYLNDHIIGQEDAKKTLSISVAHHYRRLVNPNIGKSNILLIGPTGTGKTELARTIAQYLNVPFSSSDASTLTMKGFMGEDVESILSKLLASCDWDVSKAEKGIVFIDEIDKIARRGDDTNSGSMAVNTTGVQQELLKLLEGEMIQVKKPSRTSPSGYDSIFLNTKNILFICAGAFVGLDKIMTQKKINRMGLNKVDKQDMPETTPQIESEHLISFGLIPEFLGRLPVICSTKELTKSELVEIIYKPKNSISSQYIDLFALDNVKLEITEEFMDLIAEESLNKKIGARGLRSIFESKMKPIFFDIDQYKDTTLILNKSLFK